MILIFTNIVHAENIDSLEIYCPNGYEYVKNNVIKSNIEPLLNAGRTVKKLFPRVSTLLTKSHYVVTIDFKGVDQGKNKRITKARLSYSMKQILKHLDVSVHEKLETIMLNDACLKSGLCSKYETVPECPDANLEMTNFKPPNFNDGTWKIIGSTAKKNVSDDIFGPDEADASKELGYTKNIFK